MSILRVKTVSTAELVNILGAVTHATPIGFVALTDARIKKTGCPYPDGVQKWTKVSAFTGTRYETAVNRQITREGNGDAPAFEAKERQWGKRISEALVSRLDEKTGEVRFYLPAQIQRCSKPIYLVPTGENNRLRAIPKATLAPWLPRDKTPETAAAQGVERAVIYRDYALSSLVSMNIGGQKYRIRS